jgi:hypothetical protein
MAAGSPPLPSREEVRPLIGTRALNAAGRLLVVAFVAVCVAVLAYGLLAAALTGAVHGGGCPPASSLPGGNCTAPPPPATTPP